MRVEPPKKTGRDRFWSRGCLTAVSLFAIGVPFSIFLMETGAFLALALTLLYPRRATRPLRDNPLLTATLFFYFLIQVFSIVYSQHPLRSLICLRGDWPVLFLPLLIFVLQEYSTRIRGLVLFLGSASLAGIYGLWQHFTGVDPLGKVVLESDLQGGYFAVGTLGGHLTYGGVMMFALVAAFSLLLTASGRNRLWLFAAIATCGAGLITCYARTSWFGAGIGIFVAMATLIYTGVKNRSTGLRLRTLLPGLVILAACLVLLFATPGLRSRLLGLLDFAEKPRIRLWATALEIFKDFPVFGAGLGAYKSHFSQYCPPGHYNATGHPHNDLLNVLSHSGLAGLVAWFALWFAVLRAGVIRITRPVSAMKHSSFLSSTSAAPLLLGTVAALFAGGLAQCYFTDEEPAAAFWFLIAVAISTCRADSDSSDLSPGESKQSGDNQ